MNLIFRMLYVYLCSFFKPTLAIEKSKNALHLLVLPNDIDINLHMNNGRYLTICDLTRIDMFIRTGLAKTMLKKKWIPVISEHTMNYKRPLKLFQRYQVLMEIAGWDDRSFQMVHSFVVDGQVIAQGTSNGVIVGSHRVIPPVEVLQAIDLARTNP
ncbi:MAG: thioesterase family protein [Gammaproteobacteria bacterium]|nr:thioesterase family protein [Gammaproteobacteria bacterium]